MKFDKKKLLKDHIQHSKYVRIPQKQRGIRYLCSVQNRQHQYLHTVPIQRLVVFV